MKFEKKSLGEVLGGLLLSIVPMLVFFAVQIVVSMVIMIFQLIKQAPSNIVDYANSLVNNPSSMMNMIIPVYVISLLCALPVYVFAFKERKPANPIKIFSWISPIAIVVVFVGIELLCSAALSLAYNVSFLKKIMDGYVKLIEESGMAELSVASTIATIILAPVVEEIIYRGITFKLIRRFTRKFWVANIIQALLFGITHANWVQGTYAFAMGLLLGFIYKKYNSLLASILGHLTFNFAGSYLVTWLAILFENNPDAGFITEITVGMIALGIGLFMVLKVDTKTAENTQAFNDKYDAEWRAMEEKKAAEQAYYYNLMQQAMAQQNIVQTESGAQMTAQQTGEQTEQIGQ